MWTAAVLSVGRLDHHAEYSGGMPFDACSASLLLRASHLQSVLRNMNRNAGLISVDVAVCFARLPSPVTVDHYRYSGRIGIGGDTQTDILYLQILRRHEYSLTDV